MAAVGIRMEIRQRELASFLQEARARPPRFDALITGIPGDLSLAYLSAMYDSHQAGGALDFGDYHSPVLDSLLAAARDAPDAQQARRAWLDRKSTRLNSSHMSISYAVFCLKKKKK